MTDVTEEGHELSAPNLTPRQGGNGGVEWTLAGGEQARGWAGEMLARCTMIGWRVWRVSSAESRTGDQEAARQPGQLCLLRRSRLDQRPSVCPTSFLIPG